MTTTTSPTPGAVILVLKQLAELRRKQGTLASLPVTTQAEIRAALRWLGEQQTPIPASDRVPYALLRVLDELRTDTLAQLQKADLDLLESFASSLIPPAVKGGRR